MTDSVFHRPSAAEITSTAWMAFTRHLESVRGVALADPRVLHRFSLENAEVFWSELLRFSGLHFQGDLREVVVPGPAGREIEDARFFPGVRLSYAENLLRLGADDAVAIVAGDERGEREVMTWGCLRVEVARAAGMLRSRFALGPGDRVAGLVENDGRTVVACLASTGLGAIWSSVGLDFGAEAIVQRLEPLAPRLLFAHRRLLYHGRSEERVALVAEVRARIPSIEAVVWLEAERPQGGRPPRNDAAEPDGSWEHPASLRTPPDGRDAEIGWKELTEGEPIATWPRFPFDHPLFVLFSSGTTGRPKCIVHGVGGTLLEHWKEHRLHADLGPGDRLLFQTSTGWMMWNWQLSALATGAGIVLRRGSATFPDPDTLWQALAREGVTVFGTSPGYLEFCREADVEPESQIETNQRAPDPAEPETRTPAGLAHQVHRLAEAGPHTPSEPARSGLALRLVLSTGAVLEDRHYAWVGEKLPGLPLQSISGGTDIIGCFFLGCPALPVYVGELSAPSLGYDVGVRPGAGGAAAAAPGRGELVCLRPFPSKPVGFWDDPGGARFHDAYFAVHPGIWTHGDEVVITARCTARILGRSDGVLNVHGVRIGPAEIYTLLAPFPAVREALALDLGAAPGGRAAPPGYLLLLVLRDGEVLDRPLVLAIKKALRDGASRHHVPGAVEQVEDLPRTRSGKVSAAAARAVLLGQDVTNRSALANPEALAQLAALGSRLGLS